MKGVVVRAEVGLPPRLLEVVHLDERVRVVLLADLDALRLLSVHAADGLQRLLLLLLRHLLPVYVALLVLQRQLHSLRTRLHLFSSLQALELGLYAQQVARGHVGHRRPEARLFQLLGDLGQLRVRPREIDDLAMPATEFLAVHPAQGCGEQAEGLSCARRRFQNCVLACLDCLHHLFHVLDLQAVGLVGEIRLDALNGLDNLALNRLGVDEVQHCLCLELHDILCLGHLPRLFVVLLL